MATAAEQKAAKRSLLGSLFGGRNAPKRANLGDENQFYYNEKLKRWVERGSEDQYEAADAAPPPPPKSFTASRPPSASSVTSAAEPGDELNIPGHSRRNSTESADEQVGPPPVNGFPKNRSQKSLYGRYVDVGFGGGQPPKSGSGTPRKDLLPTPLSTSAPAPNIKFFVPQPATPTTPSSAGYQVSADSSTNSAMKSSENGNSPGRNYFTSNHGTEPRESDNGNAMSHDDTPSNDTAELNTSQLRIPPEATASSDPAAVMNGHAEATHLLEAAANDPECNGKDSAGHEVPDDALGSHPIVESSGNDVAEDGAVGAAGAWPAVQNAGGVEQIESAAGIPADGAVAAGESAQVAGEGAAVAVDGTGEGSGYDGSGYDWSQWANFDWSQWGAYEDWTEEQQQWYQCYQQWYMWYYHSQGTVEGAVEAAGVAVEAAVEGADMQSVEGGWGGMQQDASATTAQAVALPVDSQPEVVEMAVEAAEASTSESKTETQSAQPPLQIVKSLTEEWLHGNLGNSISPEPLPPPREPHTFPSPQTDSDLSLPNTPVQHPSVQTNPLFSGDLKLRNRLEWESDDDDSSQHSLGASPKSMGLNYSSLSPLSKDGRLLGGLANHALSAAGQLAGGLLSTAASQLSKDNTNGVLSWLNPGQEAGEAADGDMEMKYELRARRFLEDKDGMAVTDALLFDAGVLGDGSLPAAALADLKASMQPAKDTPPVADDQVSTTAVENQQDNWLATEEAQQPSAKSPPAIDLPILFPLTPDTAVSPVETPSISPSPHTDTFLETPPDASPDSTDENAGTAVPRNEPCTSHPPSPAPPRPHTAADHHIPNPSAHTQDDHQPTKGAKQAPSSVYAPLATERSDLSNDSDASDVTGYAVAGGASEYDDDASTSLHFSASQRTTMDGSMFGDDAAYHQHPSEHSGYMTSSVPEAYPTYSDPTSPSNYYEPSPSAPPSYPEPSLQASTSSGTPPSLPNDPHQAAIALISQLRLELSSTGHPATDTLTTLSMLAEQVALINSTQRQHPDPSLPSTSSSPPTIPSLHDAKVLSLVHYHQHATMLQTRQVELDAAQEQLRQDAELLLTLPVDAEPEQSAEIAAIRTRVQGIASHPLADALEHLEQEPQAAAEVALPRSDSPAPPPTPGSSMDMGARKSARDDTTQLSSSAQTSAFAGEESVAAAAAASVASAAVVSHELEQLQGENGQLREELGALQGENGQLKEELGALQGENGQLRQELGVLQGEHGQLRAEASSLQASLHETQGVLLQEQGINSQLREESEQLMGENGQLRERNGQLEGETAQLREENAQLVGETTQLREENAQLAGERDQLREENAGMRIDMQETEAKLAQQQQQIEQLHQETASISGSLREAQSSLGAAQEENAKLHSEYEQLQGDHEDLLVALAAESEKVEALYGVALHHGASAEELDAKIDGIDDEMMNDGQEGEGEGGDEQEGAVGAASGEVQAEEEEGEQPEWEV